MTHFGEFTDTAGGLITGFGEETAGVPISVLDASLSPFPKWDSDPLGGACGKLFHAQDWKYLTVGQRNIDAADLAVAT